MNKLIFILLLGICTSANGQSGDPFFLGSWVGHDVNGKIPFEPTFTLDSNGTGHTGQGASLLSMNLQKWITSGDTLFLETIPIQSDTLGKSESLVMKYIITERNDSSFVGQCYFPEMANHSNPTEGNVYSFAAKFRFTRRD